MDTTTNAPREAGGSTTSTPVPAPPPPFRCPHCRNVYPAISYGELVYQSQVLHVDTDGSAEDWDASDYGDADGSYYLSATCQMCERDITEALIRYDAKHPGNSLPTTFVHEVQVPRSLPMPRNSRIVKEWALWDDRDLQGKIDHLRTALGHLLDEQSARTATRYKQQLKAAQAAGAL